jgi:hypothetical protein
MTPASPPARNITVGGMQVEFGSAYHFNQGVLDIGISVLSFRFTYTDYARSEEFSRLRSQF